MSEEEFRSLQTQHGAVLEVDLFTSPLNFKVQKFFCPFRHPLAEAVDALAQDWNRFKQVWLFPPPNLIGLVAEKLRAYQGGVGVLVISSKLELLRAFPRRCMLRELILTSPPRQKVLGASVLASEDSEHFRVWSF